MNDNVIKPGFPAKLREVRLEGLREVTGKPTLTDFPFPRLPKDERSEAVRYALEEVRRAKAALATAEKALEMVEEGYGG